MTQARLPSYPIPGLSGIVAALVTMLRLLSGLFLRPSAWRAALHQIDPTLPPDVRLADLTPAHWQNPALRRMLWQMLIASPLLAALVAGSMLALFGVSRQQLLFGVMTAVLNTLTIFLIFATLSSLSSGLPGGLSWGITTGIGFGITQGMFDIPTTLLFGLGIAITFCNAVAFDRTLEQYAQPALSRLLVGSLLGSLVGALAVSAAAVLRSLGPLDLTSEHSIGLWLVSIWAIALLPVAALTGWRRGLLLSALLSLLTVISNLIGFHVLAIFSDPALQREMFHIGYNFAFCSLGALTFALARMLGGALAGAIAGTLGVGGSWMVLMSTTTPAHSLSLLLLGLTGLLLGLLLSWYSSMVLYPLELTWNTALYQLDRQLYHDHPRLLRWNAAFWHETQSLSLHGLDSHVVLLASVHPMAGQQVLNAISTSRQRWAAQAAQHELDLRLLAGCSDVISISLLSESLASGLGVDSSSLWIERLLQLSREVAVAVRYEHVTHQRWLLLHVRGELEQLAHAVMVSADPTSSRIYQIVQHWRILIDQAIAARTAEIELHQEIDSPYVVGLPLSADQDIFIGRHAIAAQIEALLRTPRCPPILLYGQRRVGKTSLLNNLGQLLPATIVPLFVDLQGCTSHDEGHARLLFNLARDMRHSAQQRRGLVLPPLSLEHLTPAPFGAFSSWLDSVEQAMDQARIATALLTLDEIESLYQAVDEGLFSERKVLGMLRHVIQHRPRLKILMAGSHTLDEIQRWSSYLINVQLLKISYLTMDEAHVLIEQPRTDFSLRYEPAASQRILALTRGHPYLVQLLCHALINVKNSQDVPRRRLACYADVEEAIGSALTAGHLSFTDIQQNQVNATDRAILHWIATASEQDVVTDATLAHIFGQPAEHLLAQLLRRDLLEPIEGGYRFQIELLRRWFAQQPEGLQRMVGHED